MKFEISPEVSSIVKEYAKAKGCTADEGAEKILRTGIGRTNAVRRYAKKQAKAPVPAKPAKAKKAAKGPLARKVKKAATVEAPAAVQ